MTSSLSNRTKPRGSRFRSLSATFSPSSSRQDPPVPASPTSLVEVASSGASSSRSGRSRQSSISRMFPFSLSNFSLSSSAVNSTTTSAPAQVVNPSQTSAVNSQSSVITEPAVPNQDQTAATTRSAPDIFPLSGVSSHTHESFDTDEEASAERQHILDVTSPVSPSGTPINSVTTDRVLVGEDGLADPNGPLQAQTPVTTDAQSPLSLQDQSPSQSQSNIPFPSQSEAGPSQASPSNPQKPPDPNDPPFSIRLTPFIDHSTTAPALYFGAVERKAEEGGVIRIGRYTDKKDENTLLGSHAPIVFKSKVVSRSHAEFSVTSGQWFIRDVKSSSGTFLNHVRLSPASIPSQPYAIKDGDILQLGMDFRGGSEEIYRCIKVRLELNGSWHKRANAFK